MCLTSRFHRYLVATIVCCIAIACCPVSGWSGTAAPGAEGAMPDPDAVIKRVLGVDAMAKNVCLIDSHNMVNAADLPGRLIAISADRQVPSDLLRYSFRKPGAKTVTQVNPPTDPIQVTRVESSQAKSGSLLDWFGASMSKEDIAEVRTVPLPATSISVDDLDEQSITQRFSGVPGDIRKTLGIITDVIPYEVWASVCKKTSRTEAGVWYIRLGRDTYCKQSDELRKYYLVAVYTPLVFYDDIGVIPNPDPNKSSSSASSVTDPWKSLPAMTRGEQLSLWLKTQPDVAGVADFARERPIAWADSPTPIEPPIQGGQATPNGPSTTQEKPQKSGRPSTTTVVTE